MELYFDRFFLGFVFGGRVDVELELGAFVHLLGLLSRAAAITNAR